MRQESEKQRVPLLAPGPPPPLTPLSPPPPSFLPSAPRPRPQAGVQGREGIRVLEARGLPAVELGSAPPAPRSATRPSLAALARRSG